MANNVVEKLLDKGFNGADIHWFLQGFGIGVWVAQPYLSTPIFLVDWNDPTEIKRKQDESKKKAEEHYEAQRAVHRKKWEEANIAADFERPRW